MFALALNAITALPCTAADDGYKVASARRESYYAGRLGRRIEDRLTVSRDGMTLSVTIGRRHTRFEKNPNEFRPGDRVRISGAVRDGRIFVLPGDIRRG